MTREDAGFEGPSPRHVGEAVRMQDTIFKDTFPGALGVHIEHAEAGHARGTLEIGPSVRHPGGYAHGGALAGFGDTVAAWATFPSLGPDEVFTTIEFKANFLTGVREGRLAAVARSVHRGRRTMVLEVRITTDDAERRPVASMLITQAILAGKGGVEIPPDV